MNPFTPGDRIKMKYAGLLGTIVSTIGTHRVIVRWDNGLETSAQIHELEKL